MNDSDSEKLWVAKDVANFGQCSMSWVYKAAERGEIPCIRIGSMLRFDPIAVKRFFHASTSSAVVPT